jgi:hypothetical protein
LQNVEIRMIPIVNPQGRKKVEEGYNCWRSNLNKIDPNRNWGYNHHRSTDEDRFFDSDGDLQVF